LQWYPVGVPVDGVQLSVTFDPFTVAVNPVGTEGIEIALVPVPVRELEPFTVPVIVSVPE
jgi:hypothetical protein